MLKSLLLPTSALPPWKALIGTSVSSEQSWQPLHEELLRLRKLPDDWDGEGTAAPEPSLVECALTLAQRLEASDQPPADRVHASVNGTIYFEWHTALGYLEIEVTSALEAESRWVAKEQPRKFTQRNCQSTFSVTL